MRDILGEGVDAVSHLSCIGATRVTLRAQLATLKAMGVKRLVVLRGDLPTGYGAGGEFQYASDLVAFIRTETGDDFHIEVAVTQMRIRKPSHLRLTCRPLAPKSKPEPTPPSPSTSTTPTPISVLSKRWTRWD